MCLLGKFVGFDAREAVVARFCILYTCAYRFTGSYQMVRISYIITIGQLLSYELAASIVGYWIKALATTDMDAR